MTARCQAARIKALRKSVAAELGANMQQNEASGGTTPDAQLPSPRYAWYALSLLILAYVVAFIDRGILALLIEPIKHDLGLSDLQMSWLLGPAFGIFYVTLGLPIGVLADRSSRRNLLMAGVVLWSLATAACGLARGFGQLFVARVFVGVGEATLSPAALSLISDLFSRADAMRAVTFFAMGQSIGAGLAFLLGGQLVLAVSAASMVVWPVVGVLAPWQLAFIAVGLPGLLVAALLLTIKEPVRRGYSVESKGQPGTLAAALRYMRARPGVFGALMLGNSVVTIIGYSYFWVPSMLARTWGMSSGNAGIAYGAVLAVGGPIGILLGARLVKHLYAKGRADAPFLVFLGSLAVGVVAASLMPLMPSANGMLAMLFPAMLALAMASGTSTAAVVHVAPAEFRAQISAAHLLVISLSGLFLGPTSVAFLTDLVFRDEAAVRYSLAVVAVSVGSVGMVGLMLGRRAYGAEALAAERWYAAKA
jgi:MFS family permease